MIIWVMVVMICPSPAANFGCTTQVVPGKFDTEQQCKEIGKIMKDNRVSFICLPTWERTV
jgi:hypothetical protein